MTSADEFYRKLEDLDWFCNSGHPYDNSVRLVESWDVAEKLVTSAEWADIRLSTRNRVTLSLHKTSFRWGNTAPQIRLKFEPLVLDKIRTSQYVHVKQIDEFRQSLLKDIVACAVTMEVSEFYSDPYHEKVADIYLAGHFPCGWSGVWPEDDVWNGIWPRGQLLVY